MQRKVGVVLSAGVARGWAHIGVLQGLEQMGIKPDIVCGCSIGALVGASYVTGHHDALAGLVKSLTRTRVLRYMDFSMSGAGLIEGRWVMKFFEDNIEDTSIEAARIKFATVATELHTGRETWLTSGSIIDAVRASIAVPGLITPLKLNGRWLVDGALVNPLPVSLCRALGADVIIGVSLNGNLVSAPPATMKLASTPPPAPALPNSNWLRFWYSGAGQASQISQAAQPGKKLAGRLAEDQVSDRPGYLEIMSDSFFLVQAFISRVRLAADPVDVLISPEVSNIGLIDFHRGEDLIAAGMQAAFDARGLLQDLGILDTGTGQQNAPSTPATETGKGA
ncbi:MAG: hypothetical protein RLZ98_6 [Pseudomonadota bacterium]|jgi:NTE family protein